jgi:DNA (cytosine-5)-methyltransferase 1
MNSERIDLLRALASRTSIDLFAGCGGLSLGLHAAGWEGLFAIERDPMAFDTLSSNLASDGAPYAAYQKWPAWLPKEAMDVQDLLGASYRPQLEALAGRVALLAGGPPCQGFSVAGRRRGDDSRNSLVNHLLDVVGVLKPALVLIENVEGIARRFVSKPGDSPDSVADQVVAALADSGYLASYAIVDASRHGVPQTRKRVVIFGVRELLTGGESQPDLLQALEAVRAPHLAALGLPVDRSVTAIEALEDLDGEDRVVCPDSPKFEAGTYKPASSRYAELMRKGVPSDALPNSHRFTRHGDRVLEMYRSAHDTQPPGRLSKEFLLGCGTKKDKKVLLDPATPASTITTHPDEFIHYREPRNITVREMARLQSFPDDFHFRGRYTINGPRRRFDVARCSQVGNAVPPLLAEALGLALGSIADSLGA